MEKEKPEPVCTCGHFKGDHGYSGTQWIGAQFSCLWEQCECDRYLRLRGNPVEGGWQWQRLTKAEARAANAAYRQRPAAMVVA